MFTNINCPICNNLIPINTAELLKGVSFKCSKCFASIAISHESMDIAKDALGKFQQIKENE